VPLGGELELVDGGTLAHSFAGRKPISSEGVSPDCHRGKPAPTVISVVHKSRM
jgi:hypothetical protein